MCFRPPTISANRTCPSCGEVCTDGTALRCPSCGTELPKSIAAETSAPGTAKIAPSGAPTAPGIPGKPKAPGQPPTPRKPQL